MIYLYKWLLILLAASVFIACDSLGAHWGKTGNTLSLTIMFAAAPIAYLIFGYLNKIETLSVSSGLVNIMIVIGTISIGLLFFKDQISPQQGVGLLLAIIAVVLMA